MTANPLPAADDPAPDKPAASPKAARSYLTAIVITAGLLGGGGFGAFVVGPRLTRHSDQPASAAAAVPEGHTPASTAASTVVFDNLVLNPAGSGGMRFLLVSVGLDVSTGEQAAEMKSRDAEVRDALLRVFSARRVEELSDIGSREPLKREIKEAIDAMLAAKVVKSVYFPQYVIQ